MDTLSVGTIIGVMVCISVPLIGFVILVYWMLIGSKQPPDVRKLRSKGDIAGLKKALDYMNTDRDFWNTRKSAVQALGEISLSTANSATARQAVEALQHAFETGGKFLDIDKISSPGETMTLGKISVEKFNAFAKRIDQVRLYALEALGNTGAQIPDLDLRLQIVDELIKTVGWTSNPENSIVKSDQEFIEEAGPIAIKALERISGQNLGSDLKAWLNWRSEYHP